MACFAATLAVIFLLGFINLSAENKDTCDIYAAVGQSPILPLSYEELVKAHVLRWTHNRTLVFYRQQGQVSVGKPDDVSATGSLLLRSVKFSSAGDYQADVHQPNGVLAKTSTSRLCVIDKVPKPQVRFFCDFKSSALSLDCITAKPEGLAFSWTLDKKTLPGETRQTLRISLNQLKGERSFTCSVANKASQETSDTVHPICKSPSPAPQLCFPTTTVQVLVAAGVVLILLLITIIIVLCYCNRCNKTQMAFKENGALRTLSMKMQELDSIGPDYETMLPTPNSPPQSPQPLPEAHHHQFSQLEAEAPSNPQLSVPTEGQQPSPVPKPRTKNLQTENI